MNLQKAANSTHKTKRIGRGQGSGMGKTATKGGKGQTARKGYNEKRGFEGGQQPLQRRLPKVGFTSKFEKAYAINIEKVKGILELAEISFESIKGVHKFPKSVKKIKLIGAGAKELASKIKDKNISTSKGENSAKKATNSAKSAKLSAPKLDKKPNTASKSENSGAKAESAKAESTKAEKSVKTEKAQSPKTEKSAKAEKGTKAPAQKPAAKKAAPATKVAKPASTKAKKESDSK